MKTIETQSEKSEATESANAEISKAIDILEIAAEIIRATNFGEASKIGKAVSQLEQIQKDLIGDCE